MWRQGGEPLDYYAHQRKLLRGARLTHQAHDARIGAAVDDDSVQFFCDWRQRLIK
jgi:hypothetical protein